MSSMVTARGVVGSLRLLGVTAAVAAGIAGFASAGTTAAPTDVAVVAKDTQLPAQACAAIQEHAPARVAVKHGCVVIGDSGPIEGAPLFS